MTVRDDAAPVRYEMTVPAPTGMRPDDFAETPSWPDDVAPRPRVVLDLDDGRAVEVASRGAIGRFPAMPDGSETGQLIALRDDSAGLSRTHLEFNVVDGESAPEFWVRDNFSTNGSSVECGGRRFRLQPGVPARISGDCVLHLGDRRVNVRMADPQPAITTDAMHCGVASHAGAKRRGNQDAACTVFPVFTVADGMGGHVGGDKASSAVVEALHSLADRDVVEQDAVLACLSDARAKIATIPAPDGRAPGSTLSGVIVTRDHAGTPCWMVVNIGDSRTYRFGRDGLTLLTRDHSVAASLVERGAVKPEQARKMAVGHVLTRVIQADSDHLPDVRLVPIRQGDRILVCSDGVTGELDDDEITRMLEAADDPQQAADALVRAVVSAGGSDDATALVVYAAA